MLLKSKWFWICTGLCVCVGIFLGVIRYKAKQQQEVQKIYKVVDIVPTKTRQSAADTTAAEQVSNELENDPETERVSSDIDAWDLFQDTETDNAHGLPQPSDDSFADENFSSPDTDSEADDFDADIEAALAYAEQRLPELRIEIPKLLRERLEVEDRIEELEPSPLRDELFEKKRQLQDTIFGLCSEYTMYSFGDSSPFQPGGEFYQLLRQNGMGVSVVEGF